MFIAYCLDSVNKIVPNNCYGSKHPPLLSSGSINLSERINLISHKECHYTAISSVFPQKMLKHGFDNIHLYSCIRSYIRHRNNVILSVRLDIRAVF